MSFKIMNHYNTVVTDIGSHNAVINYTVMLDRGSIFFAQTTQFE